jgi:hypothetical protein
MNLKQLVNKAKDKSNFVDLKAYIAFCEEYLNYISDNLQATIVSQNENHYRFYQYKKEGNFQITRPINSNLMYDAKTFEKASKEFLKVCKALSPSTKKMNRYDIFSTIQLIPFNNLLARHWTVYQPDNQTRQEN